MIHKIELVTFAPTSGLNSMFKKYTKLVCTSQTPKLGSGAGQLNEVNKNKEV